jgi:hypothetical protein
VVTGAKKRAREIESSPVFRMIARFGFAVNGGLHILIGAIAIGIALGGRHQEIDQSGALRQVASTPGGIVELWIAVIGLGALGVWESIQAFVATGRRQQSKWAARTVAAGRAVVYLVLCITVLSYVLGARTTSEDSRTLSAKVMATPGGVLLLVAIGLTVLGIGVWFLVMGITGRFVKIIRVPGGVAGVAVVTIGRVGYLGQGLTLGIVGVLFVVGSVTSNPDTTAGLDGALKALAELPFGEVLLAIVAAGLIVYGVYGILRARFQVL